MHLFFGYVFPLHETFPTEYLVPARHVRLGRVIIPVLFAQLFSCDETMLQNVIDDGLRTLCGDSSQAIKELFWKFRFLCAFFF